MSYRSTPARRRAGRSGRPPWVGLLVLLLLIAACRDDETEVSGNSWECSCQFVAEAQRHNADVFACAVTSSEASDVAAGCLAAAGDPPVLLCDCVESSITFCDLGECRVW